MRTRVLILFAALLLSAGAVARADRSERVPLRAPLDTLPMELGAWRGSPQPPMTARELEVLGLSDYLLRQYSSPEGGRVGLYIGYWQSQRQGETIHSPQNCLPGAGWEPIAQDTLHIPDPRAEGAEIPVNRYVIQKGIERQVVLYWFQSHGRIVASEYWSKVFLVTDAIRMNRTDGAIVRVIAPSSDGPDAAAASERLALRFVNDLVPHLDSFLPK